MRWLKKSWNETITRARLALPAYASDFEIAQNSNHSFFLSFRNIDDMLFAEVANFF